MKRREENTNHTQKVNLQKKANYLFLSDELVCVKEFSIRLCFLIDQRHFTSANIDSSVEIQLKNERKCSKQIFITSDNNYLTKKSFKLLKKRGRAD